MRWDVVPADARKMELSRALVDTSARRGWHAGCLEEASLSAIGDANGWRRFFPKGSRDAIWFISEVSDASMKAAFDAVPAADMTEVIMERFAQNDDLKPFVRRVMFFDLAHPFQALARMQRTARVMVDCLAPARRDVGNANIWALNAAYTLTVFVWLFDKSVDQAPTRNVAAALMRWLRL